MAHSNNHLRKWQLSQLLFQSLKFPSVTLHDGAEFIGLRQDEDGVRATFRHHAIDGPIEIRGRFLIGADGHKSAVRSATGLRVRERVYPQRFIMADFEDDSGLGDEARLL